MDNLLTLVGTGPAPTILTRARVSLSEWHDLAVVADFGSRTYSFFVDDEWLGTFGFDPNNGPGVDYTNTLTRGSILAYTAPDTATLMKASYAAHYDKFVIEAESRSDEQN